MPAEVWRATGSCDGGLLSAREVLAGGGVAMSSGAENGVAQLARAEAALPPPTAPSRSSVRIVGAVRIGETRSPAAARFRRDPDHTVRCEVADLRE